MNTCMFTGLSTPSFTTDGIDIIMELGIEDSLLGNIIGRGGVVLKEIKDHSGARLTVAPKGVLMPGTSYRQVKVIGSQPQVQAALGNIASRIEAAGKQDNRRPL